MLHIVLLLSILVPHIVQRPDLQTAKLAQIGTSTTAGVTTPLFAMQIGDVHAASVESYSFCEAGASLGSNCTNSIIWVRDEKTQLWTKAAWLRPANVDEFMLFLKDPAPWRHEENNVSLPWPVAGMLTPEQLDHIDFIAQFQYNGSIKIYFKEGTTREQVEDVFDAVLAPRSIT